MKTKEYKGFVGEYEFIKDEDSFFGKISNIDDLITFESKDIANIQIVFEEAVDDYLDLCDEVGKH